MVEGRRGPAYWPRPGPDTPQHQQSLVCRDPSEGGRPVTHRIRRPLHGTGWYAPDPLSHRLAPSNGQAEPARDANANCPTGTLRRLRIRGSIQPGVQAGIRTAARAMETSTDVGLIMAECKGMGQGSTQRAARTVRHAEHGACLRYSPPSLQQRAAALSA